MSLRLLQHFHTTKKGTKSKGFHLFSFPQMNQIPKDNKKKSVSGSYLHFLALLSSPPVLGLC